MILQAGTIPRILGAVERERPLLLSYRTLSPLITGEPTKLFHLNERALFRLQTTTLVTLPNCDLVGFVYFLYSLT